MSKRKKLPVDELLRLACVYAERDQESYADAVRDSPGDEAYYQEAMDFVAQIRAYRTRRWGRTRMEYALNDLVPVSIQELAFGPDTDGKFPEK